MEETNTNNIYLLQNLLMVKKKKINVQDNKKNNNITLLNNKKDYILENEDENIKKFTIKEDMPQKKNIIKIIKDESKKKEIINNVNPKLFKIPQNNSDIKIIGEKKSFSIQKTVNLDKSILDDNTDNSIEIKVISYVDITDINKNVILKKEEETIQPLTIVKLSTYKDPQNISKILLQPEPENYLRGPEIKQIEYYKNSNINKVQLQPIIQEDDYKGPEIKQIEYYKSGNINKVQLQPIIQEDEYKGPEIKQIEYYKSGNINKVQLKPSVQEEIKGPEIKQIDYYKDGNINKVQLQPIVQEEYKGPEIKQLDYNKEINISKVLLKQNNNEEENKDSDIKQNKGLEIKRLDYDKEGHINKVILTIPDLNKKYNNESEIEVKKYTIKLPAQQNKSNSNITKYNLSKLNTNKDYNFILIYISNEFEMTENDLFWLIKFTNYLVYNNNFINLISNNSIIKHIYENLYIKSKIKFLNYSNDLTDRYEFYKDIFIFDYKEYDNMYNNIIYFCNKSNFNKISKIANYNKIYTNSLQIKTSLYNKENVKHIKFMNSYYDFKNLSLNENLVNLLYICNGNDEDILLKLIDIFIKTSNSKLILTLCSCKFINSHIYSNKINYFLKHTNIRFRLGLNYLDYCKEINLANFVLILNYDEEKYKEIKQYKKTIITNQKIKYLYTTINFKNENSLYELLQNIKHYDIVSYFKNNFSIMYLSNTGISKNISGYTIRTDNILTNLNNYKKTLCFVKPEQELVQGNLEIYYENNNIYIYLNVSNYEEELTNFIKSSKIKLIWSASDNYNGLISAKLGKLFGIKSFYEIRGFWHLSRKSEPNNNLTEDYYITYEEKEKQASQNNDYVICENRIIQQYCLEKFNIEPKKILILNNGINFPDNYTPIYSNLNNKKLVFGYIGSIVSYEGLKYLIKAIHILGNLFDTKLLIIGGGNTLDSTKTKQELDELIIEYNLSHKIEIINQVPYDTIQKYYDLIDIICLPRIDIEVCNIVAPLKPYEAMMYGKIILASSVDALTDIITDNYNGIIFEKNNLNDLINKIKNIINKNYNLELIQQNGYKYIESKTWHNNLKDIYKLCNKTL